MITIYPNTWLPNMYNRNIINIIVKNFYCLADKLENIKIKGYTKTASLDINLQYF